MMLRGLESLHASQWCHRDFKLENVVMDDTGFLRLIDFGFAASCTSETRFGDSWGTPSYMAPECFLGNYNGVKADVFALGVSLFYLYFLKLPFDHPQDKQRKEAFYHSTFKPKYEFFRDHNDAFWKQYKFHADDPRREDLKALLNCMLAEEDQRISVAGIRETEWFKTQKESNEELAQMFVFLTDGTRRTVVRPCRNSE